MRADEEKARAGEPERRNPRRDDRASSAYTSLLRSVIPRRRSFLRLFDCKTSRAGSFGCLREAREYEGCKYKRALRFAVIAANEPGRTV